MVAVLADVNGGVEEPSGGWAELVDVGAVGDVDRPIAGSRRVVVRRIGTAGSGSARLVNWRTVDLDGDGIAGAQMSAESEDGSGAQLPRRVSALIDPWTAR